MTSIVRAASNGSALALEQACVASSCDILHASLKTP